MGQTLKVNLKTPLLKQHSLLPSYFSSTAKSVDRREINSNCDRHSKDREAPVPLYVGLSVHAQKRKRELGDTLFKLGMSISYDRVLGISTEIGNSVCRRFKEDGVLCPIKLRRGPFTTSAIDNIDHNPSSKRPRGLFMELAFPFSKIYLKVIQDVSERRSSWQMALDQLLNQFVLCQNGMRRYPRLFCEAKKHNYQTWGGPKVPMAVFYQWQSLTNRNGLIK